MDSGRLSTREDGARLRPQWISTRFEDLIKKYGLVQDKRTAATGAVNTQGNQRRDGQPPGRPGTKAVR